MKQSNSLIFLTTLMILLGGLSCQLRESPASLAHFVKEEVPHSFKNYWYQGKAELNSYDLEQFRYGEARKGEAVMVFVTEDFSKSKQVKLDNPSQAGKDKVPVMKLNSLRKFKTGIYDYSMMQSVFTPVDLKKHPHTLKTTASSQEWCGHTFTQFNLEDKHYRISQFSYFEKEGDKVFKKDNVLLEDELWTRIRIAPESIPTGKVEIIPSSFNARLAHKKIKPHPATIRMEEGEAMNLMVEYLNLGRSLTITFEAEFPHRILSWSESDGKEGFAGISSKGNLKKTIQTAYWKQNANEYEGLRDSLRLNY